MESITAVFHNGRIELAQPVDWPDGTRVEVTPITNSQQCGRTGYRCRRWHVARVPPVDTLTTIYWGKCLMIHG